MRPFTAVAVVALGLALLGAALCGAYSLGAGAERAKSTAALASVRSELANIQFNADRSMGELRFSMVESQGRIDGIGRGLGEAVDLAARTTGRSRRIAILAGAIDAAVRELRGIKVD